MHSGYTRGRTSSNFQCKSGTAGAYVNSPLQIPRGGCYINPSGASSKRLGYEEKNYVTMPIQALESRLSPRKYHEPWLRSSWIYDVSSKSIFAFEFYFYYFFANRLLFFGIESIDFF